MEVKGSAYIVDIARTEATREKSPAASAPAANGASGIPGSDRVELSGARPDLEQLKRELAALPEVRPDRVALAKQKLQDGGYQLDGTLVARKMMESMGRG